MNVFRLKIFGILLLLANCSPTHMDVVDTILPTGSPSEGWKDLFSSYQENGASHKDIERDIITDSIVNCQQRLSDDLGFTKVKYFLSGDTEIVAFFNNKKLVKFTVGE